MQKYLDYMIIGVKEQIVYKGAFVAKLLSKIVYLYLQLSIWNALFSTGSQIDSALSREETICYVTVATIISSFMECNTIEWVNNQIRTGNISIELIRPIRYRAMLFSRHLGSSILKLALFTLPLCVIVKVFVKEVYLCDAQIVLGLVSFSTDWSFGFLAYSDLAYQYVFGCNLQTSLRDVDSCDVVSNIFEKGQHVSSV